VEKKMSSLPVDPQDSEEEVFAYSFSDEELERAEAREAGNAGAFTLSFCW
jgi:hypothetical protein